MDNKYVSFDIDDLHIISDEEKRKVELMYLSAKEFEKLVWEFIDLKPNEEFSFRLEWINEKDLYSNNDVVIQGKKIFEIGFTFVILTARGLGYEYIVQIPKDSLAWDEDDIEYQAKKLANHFEGLRIKKEND